MTTLIRPSLAEVVLSSIPTPHHPADTRNAGPAVAFLFEEDNVIQDAVKKAVVARIADLIGATTRLEKIIAAGETPGMLLARAAVDIDAAAAGLADHAAKLETPSAWPPLWRGTPP